MKSLWWLLREDLFFFVRVYRCYLFSRDKQLNSTHQKIVTFIISLKVLPNSGVRWEYYPVSIEWLSRFSYQFMGKSPWWPSQYFQPGPTFSFDEYEGPISFVSHNLIVGSRGHFEEVCSVSLSFHCPCPKCAMTFCFQKVSL